MSASEQDHDDYHRAVRLLMEDQGLSYAQAASAVAEQNLRKSTGVKSADAAPRTVLQDWVCRLSFMQQSVLLSAIRNEDCVEKDDPSKGLIRWYRRCVLISAFDRRALIDPTTPGGGSFTGPIDDIKAAADAFIRRRDAMSLHYYAHAMHAFQIVGYKHPISTIAAFWESVYVRMAHVLHLFPEKARELDARLGDDIDGWKAREDEAGGCST
jgi:hypothetical protein